MGPEGATGYPVAQVTALDAGFACFELSVNVGAAHWQLCGDDELSMFTYPVTVAFEGRIPVVQEAGEAGSRLLLFVNSSRDTSRWWFVFRASFLGACSVMVQVAACYRDATPSPYCLYSHIFWEQRGDVYAPFDVTTSYGDVSEIPRL